MSFILDALKKSESERQRQGGPALFEVKVAPPRHRVAPWVALLAVLLAINLGVVGWLLARSPFARSSSTPVPTATPAATSPSASADVQPAARGVAASNSPTQAARAITVPTAGASPTAAPPTGASPVAGSPAAASRVAASPAAGSSAGTGADASEGSDSNPADYEPAVEPRQGAVVPDSGGSVVRETESGLRSYQEAAAAPGADLPSLRLDLHVYSQQPAERFVFLNMVKLHEGESLPQGVRVDTITPDGVIVSYRGERFVLQRQ